MTVHIIRGAELADLAKQIGIDPAQATQSRVLAALTPSAASAYAGHVKARQIRAQALARDASDTARQRPEHADDWEAIAAAFRCQLADGSGIDPLATARALLEGLQ